MSDSGSIAVAVAQFAPTGDAAANLGTMAEMTRLAAGRGARVLVFPEYSSYFVEPFDDSLAANAEILDGPFVAALTRLAADTKTHIVAGMIERTDRGRVRNTVIAVNESGLQAKYRKQHLYDAFGQRESDWIEAGDLGETSAATFPVEGLRFGLMTCYDLRFPEVTRTLVDAGSDVIVVPAEWVRGPLKEHHWRTLIQARAIENTVYLVAADHPPPLGVGHSMIVDPAGVQRASVGTGTDIAIGYLDRDSIDRIRRVNPALELRRYQVIPAS